MPRLYAYPATLSRSVAARATEREPNALYGREVYIQTPLRIASLRATPRRVASRRVSRSSPRAVPTPRRAPPHPATRLAGGRVADEERGALRCPITRALYSRSPRISRSCPRRLLFFLFLFHSFLFFFFLFLPPVSFPSRLCSPRRVSSNAIMLGLVCLGSFVFSPALLGFCYWTDLSVSYNDYCYRSLGI